MKLFFIPDYQMVLLNENISFLNNDINSEIEVPNWFYNYLDKYPTPNIQSNCHESWSITPFNIQSRLSDIQIVCNYFYNEKILNEKDIHISFPRFQSRIFHKFNIKNPTYYQINSLIYYPLSLKFCLNHIILIEIY